MIYSNVNFSGDKKYGQAKELDDTTPQLLE
jgi:hypothetical protein